MRRRRNQDQLALSLDPRVDIPPIYFASGTNHAGEVRGFAEQGMPMGTAVDKCNEPCLRAYEGLRGSGIPTFIDSGAFSEIEPQFKGKGKNKEFVGFKTKKPITPVEWRRRLDIYHRLAASLGPLLYAVAPDKVGDQQETLRRLATYRDDVLRLIDAGVNVIVPLQGGAMPLSQFDREVQRVLGTDRYVVGFPMKKAATSPDAVADFLRYRQPAAVHMLGLGEKNPNIDEILALLKDLAPQTKVSLDSVKISAEVGWKYKEYVKRMKSMGLEPMPEEDWKPQHHLILPGFRQVKDAPVPREMTLALHHVTPIRPHWGAQMYRTSPQDLGLEEFGIEVFDDREMVDRVDEWMDKKLRKEAIRQADLRFYWNEYEDPSFIDPPLTRPPDELPWLPNAGDWPMSAWKKDKGPFGQGYRNFLRSPHKYITEDLDWDGSPEAYAYAANILRPLYLSALGKTILPGSDRATVQSAYGKRQQMRAALGKGPEAQRFQAWKKAMRSVPTQKDWEMLAALRFWKDPYKPAGPYELSPQEVVFATETLTYPEFDAVRLLYWDELPQAPHDLEGERLQAMSWKQQKGQFDATEAEVAELAEWLHSLPERFGYKMLPWVEPETGIPARRLQPPTKKAEKAMGDYLKSVLEYRVARYQGKPAAVPKGPKLPRLAGGWPVPGFEVAEFWHDPAAVAAANPRRKLNKRGRGSWSDLKRKLMRG